MRAVSLSVGEAQMKLDDEVSAAIISAMGERRGLSWTCQQLELCDGAPYIGQGLGGSFGHAC